MSRSRHPNPHIEKVVQYAESQGWRVILSNGHAWGHLYCPWSNRDGCKISVWSTPKGPEHHARKIRKKLDSCPHRIELEQVIENEEGENE